VRSTPAIDTRHRHPPSTPAIDISVTTGMGVPHARLRGQQGSSTHTGWPPNWVTGSVQHTSGRPHTQALVLSQPSEHADREA
jgi:hypothetical protein